MTHFLSVHVDQPSLFLSVFLERGVSGRFFNFGVKNKVRGVFVGAVLVSLALSE